MNASPAEANSHKHLQVKEGPKLQLMLLETSCSELCSSVSAVSQNIRDLEGTRAYALTMLCKPRSQVTLYACCSLRNGVCRNQCLDHVSEGSRKA